MTGQAWLARRAATRPARSPAVVLAIAFLLALAHPVSPALARMTDVETVASTLSTETLDPPTSLDATAALGLVVTLTWTPTVDSRATGYQVLRGTSSGGPYTQLATVTPRTATSYVDLPLLPGTYYYVLRTYYGGWTSVTSNQDSVFAL
jgi:hypothetical protein